MYIIGRAVRGKKPFVKSVNSLQSGNKMKEGFFMNCHREGYFASFLTFSYCKKLFWSQKQDMVAKRILELERLAMKAMLVKKY